jgi:hypothetical protein
MSDTRDWSPRREESCSATRVARVVVVESLMSRSRCSTPISSASSASMADGTWRKVFRVSVPSYSRMLFLKNELNDSLHTSLISSTAK